MTYKYERGDRFVYLTRTSKVPPWLAPFVMKMKEFGITKTYIEVGDNEDEPVDITPKWFVFRRGWNYPMLLKPSEVSQVLDTLSITYPRLDPDIDVGV